MITFTWTLPPSVPPPATLPPGHPPVAVLQQASYGTDISSYPDYDPLGTLVSGNVALAQRVARRLTNPRGAWFWAPNECTDLRAYLNDIITPDRQSSIKSDVERETLHEEQVQSVSVEVTISDFSMAGQSITISAMGSTRDGPFNFVMSVSQVTLAILQAG